MVRRDGETHAGSVELGRHGVIVVRTGAVTASGLRACCCYEYAL